MMNWFSPKPKRIFLDYASATPVLKEVKDTMDKFWSRYFYNPSSIYEEGLVVKREVEELRTRVARLLGVASTGIVFTSSGTESDNLAILGAFEAFKDHQKFLKLPPVKPHLIISAVEHPAVQAAAEEVVRRGGELSVLPVNEEGIVSLDALRKILKKNTFLVSVALANHEIGTIEPLAKVGRLIREYRKGQKSPYPYLHTDASQTPCFLPLALEGLQADLMTLDASKIYGPKVVGMLVLRTGVKIRPQIVGGSQEGGRRAGTVSAALIAGMVKAIEMAQGEREKEVKRMEKLRKVFIETLTKKVPVIINGHREEILPNIVSVSIPGSLAELLVLKLDQLGVLASVGTACSLDERVSGSPVIRAIGKPELAESTIRFSFGKFTTESDVKNAAAKFGSIGRL